MRRRARRHGDRFSQRRIPRRRARTAARLHQRRLRPTPDRRRRGIARELMLRSHRLAARKRLRRRAPARERRRPRTLHDARLQTRRRNRTPALSAANAAGDDIADLAGVGAEDGAALSRTRCRHARAHCSTIFLFRYEDLRVPTPAARSGRPAARRTPSARVVASRNGAFAASKSSKLRCATTTEERSSPSGSGNGGSCTGVFTTGMRLFVRGRAERSFAGPAVNVSQYAHTRPRAKRIAANWSRCTARARI